jgi:hypothetical protein
MFGLGQVISSEMQFRGMWGGRLRWWRFDGAVVEESNDLKKGQGAAWVEELDQRRCM